MDRPSEPAPAPSEPEPWDDAVADWLIGQYALVGITWLGADGETVSSQSQVHGRIVSADRTEGVVLACEGRRAGERLTLPPETRVFQVAEPGEYRLRSTGEVIVDPDVLASWSVREPTTTRR